MNIKRESVIIRQLLYLLATIRNGKITQTAEENGIKASNLSSLLKELEEVAGTPLLNRKSDGVEPTMAGKELYKLAKEFEVTLNKFRNLQKKINKNEKIVFYMPQNIEIDLSAFRQDCDVVRTDDFRECDVAIVLQEPEKMSKNYEMTKLIYQNGKMIFNTWAVCKKKQNRSAYKLYKFLVEEIM